MKGKPVYEVTLPTTQPHSHLTSKGTCLCQVLFFVSYIFISVGDCIVAVNDISTVNVTHQQAVEALKAAGGVVTLVILDTLIFILTNPMVTSITP